MPPRPALSSLFVTAPELARRLGFIMAGLASVVARRFLRDPKRMALIVPLWSWLNRTARRFERIVTRPAVMRVQSARRDRAPRSTVRVRLPSGRDWLVRALGWEAAGYGSQLAALLAEPDMQAMLATVPAMGRLFRPLCRMLAVTALDGTPAAPIRRVRAKVPRPKVPRPKISRPKPEVEVERRHSPVSSWMHRPAKKPR